MRRGRTLAVTLLLAIALAACGSSSGGDASATTATGGDGSTATTVESAAGTDAGSSGASSAIPQSDAIDAIAKDIATDPNGPNLAATCTSLAAGLSALAAGATAQSTVDSQLSSLVTAVRKVDATVADALARDAKAAGTWCHDEGFSV